MIEIQSKVKAADAERAVKRLGKAAASIEALRDKSLHDERDSALTDMATAAMIASIELQRCDLNP